ncbi:MAG: hypothetical protein WAZ36_04915 [Sediminibacterium sp.]
MSDAEKRKLRFLQVRYERVDWSARELQDLLDYSKWENFEKLIQKVKDACRNAGEEVAYHFPDVRKMIALGKGAEKEIECIK